MTGAVLSYGKGKKYSTGACGAKAEMQKSASTGWGANLCFAARRSSGTEAVGRFVVRCIHFYFLFELLLLAIQNVE